MVAEELHFSRAAARLYLTQQALSREIKELESRVGAKLLDRSTRRVALTAAGDVFLAGARAVLAALDGAVAETARTVRGLSGTLRLGYVPGAALELTGYIVDEFRRHHPDVDIAMREFPIGDPSAGLADGTSDVALLRLPLSAPNLAAEPLFVDPVVAMLSAGHRHADRTSVAVGDLLDDPITLTATDDEEHRAFWSLAAAQPRRAGARGVEVNSITEEAQLVAAGMAVAVTSAAVMHYLPVPGVRYLPIDDWPGSVVAVARPAVADSPLSARFMQAACMVRDREAEVVRGMENRLLRSRTDNSQVVNPAGFGVSVPLGGPTR